MNVCWSYGNSARCFATTLLLVTYASMAFAADGAYKCVRQGKVAYQEQPCDAGAAQTNISAGHAVEPPPASAPIEVTDEDKLAQFEIERLRRESLTALQRARAQLAGQQTRCERESGVVFSRKPGSEQSLTGATYVQTDSPAANAAAVRCIGRANELQQEVGRLRQECADRRCE